jgi:hypothetical protein
MNKNEQIVKRLWALFDKRKFSDVKSLLSENFVCVWPQSGEIIRGADNFIAINENYPGKWTISCKRIIGKEDILVSEVELECDGKIFYAVSFFEFQNSRISKLTEYWGEPYDAQKWRAKWVEKGGGEK